MTIPRSLKIDLSVTPFYHCMARCVRQSYLCGFHAETGKDFSHRKAWLERRLAYLSQFFAIEVCSYAIMNNHYHTVLFVDVEKPKTWTDAEVKERWSALCPRDVALLESQYVHPKIVERKITIWRERLTDISWFMKSINEPLARLSNKEDKSKGRFWEGRFKSQALLDEGAVLAAMAYTDLNPIRSKLAQTPEESDFTSIKQRIKEVTKSLKKTQSIAKPISIKEVIHHCDTTPQPLQLMAFGNGKNPDKIAKRVIDFRLSEYLQLVDTTGRILREDKRGAIPSYLSPILERLHLSTKGWFEMVNNIEEGFSHAIGHENMLMEFGSRYTQRTPKGVKAAKRYYLKVA
jgi:REP element-mobilizing transposase RayT